MFCLEEYLFYIKVLVIIMLATIAFRLIYQYSLFEGTYQLKQKARGKLVRSMQQSNIDYLNFQRVDMYLLQYGVKFMFQDKINPLSYLLIKFCIAFLFSIMGMNVFGFLSGVCLWFPGFFLIDIVFKISNTQDNHKMSKDIRAIYDTLRLQTKANVYIIEALSECYLCVQSERLKSALLKLTSNIIAKSNINEAIDDFNKHFKNTFMDTLCIIIKQSLESGKSIQILEDMSGHR